jgi:hypothetical protein
VWEQDTRKTTWYTELGLAAAVTACEAPLPGSCRRRRSRSQLVFCFLQPSPRSAPENFRQHAGARQACAAATRPAAARFHFEARSGCTRQRSPPAACTAACCCCPHLVAGCCCLLVTGCAQASCCCRWLLLLLSLGLHRPRRSGLLLRAP